MISILKKSLLLALACVCVGTYGVVEAQGATDAQTKVSGPLEMSVEAAVPGVVMPSPVHVFTTVQVVYVYEPGIDPYVNKAGGALIFYRTSTKLKGDISDDHKIHKVIETERVDGTKVTFKGGKKMVYLASWMKDGQNHSLEFQRPVTRDVAKAIIHNIVEEKSHTK